MLRLQKNQFKQWWLSEQGDLHTDLKVSLEAIRSQQLRRQSDILLNMRLYGANLRELFPFSEVWAAGMDVPLNINVIASAIDTFCQKLAKSRPRVMHLPVGGSWSSHRIAEARTEFIDGVWYGTKHRHKAIQWARDAAITGTGVIKVFGAPNPYPSTGTKNMIVHEVVPQEEILVDEQDARYGTPRCYYHRRYADRSVLRSLYQEAELLIDDAGSYTDPTDRWAGFSTQSDQVLVTEAWHLPSGPEAGDGRHVICVDTGTLLDEEWNHPTPNLVFLRFLDPLRGFWGESLVAKLESIQGEMNELLTSIRDNLRAHGNPRIAVERGSKVVKSHLDNSVGSIIEYTGTPPQLLTPGAIVSPEVYSFVWQLYQKAFEVLGVSQMSAQSVKPAGLNSGRAIMALGDVESERHVLEARNYEDAHIEVSEQDFRVGGDLSKIEPEFSSIYIGKKYGRRYAKRVKFLDIAEGEFVVRAWPTGVIRSHPGGALEISEEIEDRGYIPREVAMDLIDDPDIDRVLELATAGLRLIDYQIERIIRDGEPQAPEPAMPLDIALQRGRDEYCLAVQNEIEEGRLQLLRDWLVAVEGMLQPPAPPVPPMPPPQEPLPPLPPPMPPAPPPMPAM